MLVISASENLGNCGENTVKDWLVGWSTQDRSTPRGLAAVGFTIITPAGPRQIDAVLWTPKACLIIEVKALPIDHEAGPLTVRLNDVWTIRGTRAPLHLAAGDRNPFNQATRAMFGVKNQIATRGNVPWVDWAVVIVNRIHEGSATITGLRFPEGQSAVSADGHYIDYGGRGKNTHRVVLAETPDHLRCLVARAGSPNRIAWDASSVRRAASALGIPALPAENELAAEFSPTSEEVPTLRTTTPILPASDTPTHRAPCTRPATGAASPPGPQIAPVQSADGRSSAWFHDARTSPPITPQSIPSCSYPPPPRAHHYSEPRPYYAYPPVTVARRRFRHPVRTTLRVLVGLVGWWILISVGFVAFKTISSVGATLSSPDTLERFQSPSGNIVCRILDTSPAVEAVCTVDATEFTPPPSDCARPPTTTVVLRPSRPAYFDACTPPTTAVASTLEYGGTIQVRGLTCRSDPDGVRCFQDDNSHGFRIARESFEVW